MIVARVVVEVVEGKKSQEKGLVQMRELQQPLNLDVDSGDFAGVWLDGAAGGVGTGQWEAALAFRPDQ